MPGGQHLTMPDQPVSYWRPVVLGVLFLALLALSIAWAWGPMKAWIDLNQLVGQLRQSAQDIGIVYATAALAVASILAVPLGVLIPLAILAFDPLQAFVCLICGATVGGAVSFWLGMYLGRDSVKHLAGPRINTISQRLAARGLLSVFIIRLLPIAPFAIVNMVAGTTQIRFRDFILGTAFGMMPGTLLAIIFFDQVLSGYIGSK